MSSRPSPSRSASAGEPKKPRLMWFSEVIARSAGVEARMRRAGHARVRERRVDPDREAGERRRRGGPRRRRARPPRRRSRARGRRRCRRSRARAGARAAAAMPAGPMPGGERRGLGGHRLAAVEARQRRPVGVERVELAARRRLDHVEGVVAVEVVQARRRLAAGAGDQVRCRRAAADRARPAGEVAVVGVGEQGLAVAAEVLRVVGLVDGEADLEGVALGIGVRVGVGGPGAVGDAAGGSPGVVRDLPSQLLARSCERAPSRACRSGRRPCRCRSPPAPGRTRRRARPGRRRTRAPRPRPRRRSAAPRREPATGDARLRDAIDVDRREPVGRVDLGLGRDAVGLRGAARRGADGVIVSDPRHRRRRG